MSRSSSVSRRSAGLSVVVALTLAACASPRDVDAGRDDVVAVALVPVPEGPASPTFARSPTRAERPLREILPYIPERLPQRLSQGLFCDTGGNLVITLDDGEVVEYGPCKHPREIDRLWWHILDVLTDGTCRPNCWPGGEAPSGETVPPDADVTTAAHP